MKLPRLWAVCDDCWENAPEVSCRYPEEIGWHPEAQKWLCSDCWEEVPTDLEERVTPLVVAKDALLGTEDQTRLLVAAAARKRMGV